MPEPRHRFFGGSRTQGMSVWALGCALVVAQLPTEATARPQRPPVVLDEASRPEKEDPAAPEDSPATSALEDPATKAGSLAAQGCFGLAALFPRLCLGNLLRQADREAQEGELSRALHLLDRASTAAITIGDPVQELLVLTKRCELYPRFDAASKRRGVWEESEQILARLPESADRVTASIYGSVIATCAGLYEQALAHTFTAERQLGERKTAEYDQLFRLMRIRNYFDTGDLDRLLRELDEAEGLEPASPRAAPALRMIEAWRQAIAGLEKQDLNTIQAIITSLPDSAPGRARFKEKVEALSPAPSQEELFGLAEEMTLLFPKSHRHFFSGLIQGLWEQEATGRGSRLLSPIRQIVADCQTRSVDSTRKISRAYSTWLLSHPDQKLALALARDRVKQAERCLEGARLDESFLRLAEQSRLDFETLAVLQVRNGLHAEAFATAEQARAFSLMRWLGRPQPDLKKAAGEDLYHRVESSKREIRSLEAEIDRVGREDVEEIRGELASARIRHDDLLLRLKLTTPGYTELAAMQVADLDTIQRHVGDASILVSYFMMPNQTLAWVLEKETWREVIIPAGREALTADVRALRSWLTWPRSSDSAAEGPGRGAHLLLDGEETAGRRLAEKLHRLLVAPLDLDTSKEKLLLVPHDSLQQLPFAVLRDPEDSTFLVQRYALSYLPSASSVTIQATGDDRKEGAVLVLGDPATDLASLEPLPYAREEAVQVGKRLGVQARVGQEARESLVRELAPELSLLLISAHGFQNRQDPRRSFLALAEDPSDGGTLGGHDGRLEMGEIFDELRFTRRPFVVLSACETGLGPRAGGDEVQGFIRAFLFAGAGAVAATLWRIDDAASSQLMQDFFRHLQEGVSAALALQKAQVRMIRDPRFAAPYFWAGFSLTGDPQVRLPQPTPP